MKVFFSWSGQRSKDMAEHFSQWLSQVVQAVDPWVSSEMDKGARWSAEVATGLAESKVGIICITPENQRAPWLLFEAGALSRLKDAPVCTLLLGMAPGDVEQPLGQFQHTVAHDRDDVCGLVSKINREVAKAGEKALSETALKDALDVYWPRLEPIILELRDTEPPSGPAPRPERELLEEILVTVRSQERRLAASLPSLTLRGLQRRQLHDPIINTVWSSHEEQDAELERIRKAILLNLLKKARECPEGEAPPPAQTDD